MSHRVAVVTGEESPTADVGHDPDRVADVKAEGKGKMANQDDSTKVPLRTLLMLLLNTEVREELIASLTGDERRAVQYQYVTVPLLARTDPNRVPDPPFPDRELARLLASALTKIEARLEQPTDERMR